MKSYREQTRESWYRFFDGNASYEYKKLYNAVSWATKKITTSTSKEIRIYKVVKLREGLELECATVVKLLRPAQQKQIEVDNEIVTLDAQSESIVTYWKNIDYFNEYKEKELKLASAH